MTFDELASKNVSSNKSVSKLIYEFKFNEEFDTVISLY